MKYLLAALLVLGVSLAGGADDRPAEAAYVRMAQRTRDGIGVTYFGREIAQVMGHEGAGWLERAGREAEERTDLLLKALDLKPGDRVADVGAGSGYFSWRMAKLVGDEGKVLAVDIQQPMLDLLMANMTRRGVAARVPLQQQQSREHAEGVAIQGRRGPLEGDGAHGGVLRNDRRTDDERVLNFVCEAYHVD